MTKLNVGSRSRDYSVHMPSEWEMTLQRYIVTSSLIGWAHTQNDPGRSDLKNQSILRIHRQVKGCLYIIARYSCSHHQAYCSFLSFQHMANEKQAQVAISTLHRTDFEGNRINVQMARSDPQMGDDDHYGPDCYDEGNGYGDSYGSYGRGRRESRYLMLAALLSAHLQSWFPPWSCCCHSVSSESWIPLWLLGSSCPSSLGCKVLFVLDEQ